MRTETDYKRFCHEGVQVRFLGVTDDVYDLNASEAGFAQSTDSNNDLSARVEIRCDVCGEAEEIDIEDWEEERDGFTRCMRVAFEAVAEERGLDL
ncbi:hypothetical protein [Longimicrobium sp.]|jgi:hypothetical protein|uniref:hypothetical protein n=1 Tax=Longimicrobium sp. TaxID=2029185 RepID=UPI002EDB0FB9